MKLHQNLLVALVAHVLLGFAIAQEDAPLSGLFAARLTTCIGIEAGSVDLSTVCNVSAVLELSEGVGFFVQVSPRFGPFYENFQVRVYRPSLVLSILGLDMFVEPGVTTGFELGEWFIRLESDFLIQVPW
jgi:hypothetical protein